MAVLRVLKGMNPGQVFPLESESSVLGRHPGCDIVLEVGAVSRQHARIVRLDDAFYVEDLNSRNGTFLNDQRVEGRRKLADNDQVKVCDIVFVFHPGLPEGDVVSASSDETVNGTLMFDDERPQANSTIMSKVDISAGATGLRLSVNAEGKLKALLEISRNLGRAVSLNDVLPKLLDSLFTIFLQADRGFIVLKDAASGRLIPRAVRHRREDSNEPIRISRTILNGVIA